MIFLAIELEQIELEQIGPMFPSFNPFTFLPAAATDDRKQSQCRNIVFNNKTGPLFVGFIGCEETI